MRKESITPHQITQIVRCKFQFRREPAATNSPRFGHSVPSAGHEALSACDMSAAPSVRQPDLELPNNSSTHTTEIDALLLIRLRRPGFCAAISPAAGIPAQTSEPERSNVFGRSDKRPSGTVSALPPVVAEKKR